MTEAACPLCRTTTTALAVSPGDARYRIAWCRGCRLRFAHPMEGAGREFYERFPVTRPEASPDDWRHSVFHQVARSPGRLLDLGCGDGQFLRSVARRGWSTFGIDLDPGTHRAQTNEGVTMVRGRIPQALAALPDGHFDAVTAFDFMEHTEDPVAVARQMARLAHPGALVFVTVPRIDRCPRMLDDLVDSPPHHLTLWTPRSLRALLSSAGLNDIRVLGKPLDARDLYSHHVWRRHGHAWSGAESSDLRDRNAYRMARVLAALGRILPWLRGHTLAGYAWR